MDFVAAARGHHSSRRPAGSRSRSRLDLASNDAFITALGSALDWGLPDLCHMLAQLSFCSKTKCKTPVTLQLSQNFRKSSSLIADDATVQQSTAQHQLNTHKFQTPCPSHTFYCTLGPTHNSTKPPSDPLRLIYLVAGTHSRTQLAEYL